MLQIWQVHPDITRGFEHVRFEVPGVALRDVRRDIGIDSSIY